MPQSASGRFIVIEGPEGAGKSTQAELLRTALQERGHEVLLTHEPGGTPSGEAIRSVMLDGRYREMTPLTELFLVCASRAQHVTEVIVPAVEAGTIVLADRFSPSTIVYQGYAGLVPMDVVQNADTAARQGLLPDLTIVLDVPAETGLARGLGGRAGDRMESKELRFHQQVRQGYLAYARTAPEKCVVISSEAPEAEVAAKVLAAALECIESTES
jgi:dTMP kinase